MLTRGAWPILDHDDDPVDGLSAHFVAALGEIDLPEVAVFAILGRKLAAHAAAEDAELICRVDMITASYPVYRVRRAGREVALVELPVGAPAALIVADLLFLRGLRAAVAVGSCGALRPMAEGEFAVPRRALRDEGASHHYLPPSVWVDTDAEVSRACVAAIEGRGHTAALVSAWTTDALLRETAAMIAHRRAQGCEVVEMECAALAAAAQFRGVRFGQVLFTADSQAAEAYDPRDWGVDSHEVALRIALDAAFGVQL